MQVEVNVQDCFFNSLQSAAIDAKQFPNPIAVETWESWFCRWLEILEHDLSPAGSYELSLRLTDDNEIQALNAQYRHINRPTDVLAFASLEVDSPQLPSQIQLAMPLYLGDIVISVETAHRQAQQQEHCLKIELAWLAAHGLLHLLGWDHPDEESLKNMLDQQETLLQGVNITMPV
ncbi:MAG: rRNA maturation RNase YbeY [Coleofasciculus sp. S288]|nr:rRNA maturation RNase YbeY [Coleofasciculus sp. S288]